MKLCQAPWGTHEWSEQQILHTKNLLSNTCMTVRRVRRRKQLCIEQLMYSIGNCENSVLLGCSLDLRYCASCLTSHFLVASSKKNKIYLEDLIYVCGQHLIFSLKLLSMFSVPQLPNVPSLSDDLNSHPAEKIDSISWKPTDFLSLASSGPRIQTHSTPSHSQICVSLCSKAQGFRTRLPFLAPSLRNPFHYLPATAMQGQMLYSLPKAQDWV